MRGGWKWVAVNCAVVIAVGASIAVAAGGGGGSGEDREARGERGLRLALPGHPGRPPGARHLSALAKELGVSSAELRRALRSIRDDVDPPEEPSREGFQQHCIALTDALGKELGKNGGEVRSAIEAVIEADVERARASGRLSEERAREILERLESAECLPPPLVGLFGRGCFEHGGRPGGRARGDVRPAPLPPGDDSSYAVPAPPPTAM